uniref:Uncharacterized protein n=1 Tax=Glossina brevipalpis TaxID=37001 RepID=A0A1A9WEH2_9MUSC
MNLFRYALNTEKRHPSKSSLYPYPHFSMGPNIENFEEIKLDDNYLKSLMNDVEVSQWRSRAVKVKDNSKTLYSTITHLTILSKPAVQQILEFSKELRKLLLSRYYKNDNSKKPSITFQLTIQLHQQGGHYMAMTAFRSGTAINSFTRQEQNLVTAIGPTVFMVVAIIGVLLLLIRSLNSQSLENFECSISDKQQATCDNLSVIR